MKKVKKVTVYFKLFRFLLKLNRKSYFCILKKYFMKKSLLIFILSLNVIAFSQSPDANLDKYWNLRWRLKNYFMVVGPNYGEGYPAGMRNQLNDVLNVGDAPNYLATYMGILATEIKILKQKGLDYSETKRELYYALYALNRWDDCETHYPWGNFDSVAYANTCFPSDKMGNYVPNKANLNGSCLRMDTPNDFVQKNAKILNKDLEKNFPNKNLGDPRNINTMFDEGLNPQFDYNVEYGYQSLERYLNDDGTKYDRALDRVRNGSMLSQDHISSLLMGLALVAKSLDEAENYNGTAFQDGEINFAAEARNIALRIGTFMKDDNYNLRLPNGEQIENRWGGNAQPLAFGFSKSVKNIYGKKIKKMKKLRIPIWHWALVLSPKTNSSTAWIVLKLFTVNNQNGRLFFSKNAKKNQKLIKRLSTSKNWEAFYPLIHSYLQDTKYRTNNAVIQKDLDLMPASGNYCTTDSKPEMWATSHKYHDSQEENMKGGNPNFNAVYGGLEFMLLMNLYVIQNPEYVVNYKKGKK